MGSYDKPNAIICREHAVTTAAGAAAVGARFAQYQKFRLKAVHAIIAVAGTSASPGNALTIKHGTTSIGLLALGTVAALGTVSVTGLNREIAALEVLSCTNGTDATGQATVVYEYETRHDATTSA